MVKISKKQRSALREIDRLSQQVKHDRIMGFGSIGMMIVIIVLFNGLGYNLGFIDPNNVALRGMMYVTALVFAGFSGIKLMKASRNQRAIDGYRQQAAISRETLDAWRKGEIE